MRVELIKVGALKTNCYFVINDNKCIIIDPGAEALKIINFVITNSFTPVGYLITHTHFDHIEALDEVKSKFNINLMKANDLFKYEIIETPGHKEDCLSFYFKEEGIIFTGDTLFKGTVGRTDLLGGCHETTLKTIEKLKKFPNETIVYPGHGDSTTIGYEKENNPWF